jgi:tetratricopeptide (TPR) repeat protein
MIMKIKYIILLLFFISANSYSQWTILRTDADSLIRIGSKFIYNVQFDEAEKCFKEVQKRYPWHPSGYFLDAMVDWWKITLYRGVRIYDDRFVDKIDKVIEICNNILDSNEFDMTGLFFKGGALGYRGRFYAIRESWLKAALDGKEGYGILLKCLESAPFNLDIMLGTGLYNYFVEAIPEKYPATKPLLLFVASGNKQIGIAQLEASSRGARYSATEAKVVLMQIFYDFEKDHFKAFKIAEDLIKEYPNNPYFHRYLGRTLVSVGNVDQFEKVWREILIRFMQKYPGYDDITSREALYYIGYSQVIKRNYKNAIKYLLKCVEANNYVDKEVTGFKTLTYIRLGNCYDKLNNRAKALEYYNKVLDMKDYNDSHNQAKNYIKNAYQ